MTPAQLLDALAIAGIRVQLKEGFVTFRGVKATYTEDLKAAFIRHRQELIDQWRCLQCGAFVTTLYGFAPILRCRSCSTSQALDMSSTRGGDA